MLSNARDQRRKWTPNYEGSFVVKHTFFGGALILADSDGQELKHLVNTDVFNKEGTRKVDPRVTKMEELVPLDTRESTINLQLKALG
ncbi:hypothetical protein CR513_03586, partial [Mucuna pruriens]